MLTSVLLTKKYFICIQNMNLSSPETLKIIYDMYFASEKLITNKEPSFDRISLLLFIS